MADPSTIRVILPEPVLVRIEVNPTVIAVNVAMVIGETPSGLINGSNKDFTTADTFFSLAVYWNGQRLTQDTDYTVTGTDSFTMVTAPFTGDMLKVDYTQLSP